MRKMMEFFLKVVTIHFNFLYNYFINNFFAEDSKSAKLTEPSPEPKRIHYFEKLFKDTEKHLQEAIALDLNIDSVHKMLDGISKIKICRISGGDDLAKARKIEEAKIINQASMFSFENLLIPKKSNHSKLVSKAPPPQTYEDLVKEKYENRQSTPEKIKAKSIKSTKDGLQKTKMIPITSKRFLTSKSVVMEQKPKQKINFKKSQSFSFRTQLPKYPPAKLSVKEDYLEQKRRMNPSKTDCPISVVNLNLQLY